MKKKNLPLVLGVFLSIHFLVSCNKDEDSDFFPEGTSSLYMMNEENGKTLLGNSDVYITNEGNFRSEQFPIFDMGKKKGIEDIEMPDFINMAPEVAVQPRHGYLICNERDIRTFSNSRKKAIAENAWVYRVFVDSWIWDNEENAIGANVRFLLGTPIKDGRIPAWKSNIGTLSWNYELYESNSFRLSLPTDDIEIEFPIKEAEENISYSINKNSVTFQLKNHFYTNVNYNVLIRCKHVYTEVFITLE